VGPAESFADTAAADDGGGSDDDVQAQTGESSSEVRLTWLQQLLRSFRFVVLAHPAEWRRQGGQGVQAEKLQTYQERQQWHNRACSVQTRCDLMRCSCLAFALTPVILGIMTRCDLNQRAPRVTASVSEKVCKPTAACCSFATLSSWFGCMQEGISKAVNFLHGKGLIIKHVVTGTKKTAGATNSLCGVAVSIQSVCQIPWSCLLPAWPWQKSGACQRSPSLLLLQPSGPAAAAATSTSRRTMQPAASRWRLRLINGSIRMFGKHVLSQQP
jgi:hypothetical protein